jgi:deoxyribodipyrimidine photo-lyase
MRMICAMFLVKDLMIDWRIGEKVPFISLLHPLYSFFLQYFMEKLIDGDLASNDGGW